MSQDLLLKRMMMPVVVRQRPASRQTGRQHARVLARAVVVQLGRLLVCIGKLRRLIWTKRNVRSTVQRRRRKPQPVEHLLRKRHMLRSTGVRSARQRQLFIGKAEALDCTAAKQAQCLHKLGR